MIEIPNLAELNITREQWIEVCQLAYFKEVENEKLLTIQNVAAQQHRWDVVYSLSLMANLCLLYTSPSPRDLARSRMPSSA